MADFLLKWAHPRGAGWSLDLSERPLIMGIVNITPDSFSDGGDFLQARSAIEHGLRLVEEGADLLDIGGESTRPGAAPLSEAEELDRVVPVIRELARRVDVPISIDTYKSGWPGRRWRPAPPSSTTFRPAVSTRRCSR
jgi:dihydropteroate synthase